MNQKLDLVFVLKNIFYEMDQKLDLILALGNQILDLIFALKIIFLWNKSKVGFNIRVKS